MVDYIVINFRLLFYALVEGRGIFKVNYDGKEYALVVEMSMTMCMGLDFDAEGRICWTDNSKYQLLVSIKVGSY